MSSSPLHLLTPNHADGPSGTWGMIRLDRDQAMTLLELQRTTQRLSDSQPVRSLDTTVHFPVLPVPSGASAPDPLPALAEHQRTPVPVRRMPPSAYRADPDWATDRIAPDERDWETSRARVEPRQVQIAGADALDVRIRTPALWKGLLSRVPTPHARQYWTRLCRQRPWQALTLVARNGRPRVGREPRVPLSEVTTPEGIRELWDRCRERARDERGRAAMLERLQAHTPNQGPDRSPLWQALRPDDLLPLLTAGDDELRARATEVIGTLPSSDLASPSDREEPSGRLQ